MPGPKAGPRYLASLVDQRSAEQRWSDDSAVGGERTFALLDRLGGEAAGLFSLAERVHRLRIRREDARDERSGFAVMLRELLVVGKMFERAAVLRQRNPNRLQLSLDRNQIGHDAIARVDEFRDFAEL